MKRSLDQTTEMAPLVTTGEELVGPVVMTEGEELVGLVVVTEEEEAAVVTTVADAADPLAEATGAAVVTEAAVVHLTSRVLLQLAQVTSRLYYMYSKSLVCSSCFLLAEPPVLH
jgi:hypothetical protein